MVQVATEASIPAAILRLEDHVVHRIAAGEVVQRPASALKEMLENSLDAGAKHITVVIKEGGLKYLQIQDDGCGIRAEDLPILCHRHTTSKLRAYEDLDTISTLGFRGEALASISYVAHVTVTTMTASMQHGYRVKYSDGEMLSPGAKPAAAVPGTSIIVEDMFYNMLPRRKAFKPGPEEHNLCLEVLQKYSIYKAGSVGFTLKRQGEARSDLHTLPTASRLDVVSNLFGPELAANLLPLNLTAGTGDVSEAVALDGPMGFTADGYISNLTHIGRRSVLLLFINGRPVDQSQLKRAIEALYVSQNPKANKPWVFLDLKLPPRHVEVNVHPTKKEVSFLYQQEVIDTICNKIEQVLLGSMSSRSFAVNKATMLAAPSAPVPETQTAVAGAAGLQDASQQEQLQEQNVSAGQGKENQASGGQSGSKQQTQQQRPSSAGLPKSASQPYYRPEKLVRTDHRSQTLDRFLVSQASAAAVASATAAAPRRKSSSAKVRAGSTAAAADGDEGSGQLLSNADMHLQAAAAEEAAAADELAQQDQQQQMFLLRASRQPKLPSVVTHLSSIRKLLADVQDNTHQELEQLFRNHTWVGMADDKLALLQHGTRLYLVNVSAISHDLFYQLCLTRWESCSVIKLAEPLSVRQLMQAALQLEEAAGHWQPEPGSSREELCGLVEALLTQKAEMLQEYVGMTFASQPVPDQQQQQQHPAGLGPGLYLTGIPQLLDGFVPDLSSLPQLILHLARDVDWDTEEECFQSLATAIAAFYAVQPLLCKPAVASSSTAASAVQAVQGSTSKPSSSGPTAANAAGPAAMDVDAAASVADAKARASNTPAAVDYGLLACHRDQQQREWLLRHVLMPAVKFMYKPQVHTARDGSVLLLTSMEKLYRVFERCGW